jgi:hypothetical protein
MNVTPISHYNNSGNNEPHVGFLDVSLALTLTNDREAVDEENVSIFIGE